MQPRPNPDGDRRLPPPRSRIGAGLDGWRHDRRITLGLSDQGEETMLASAFDRFGWEVTFVDSLECAHLAVAVTEFAKLLITDSPELTEVLIGMDSPHVGVVLVVDDKQPLIRAGYACGADWIIPRPINPDDPLGWREFGWTY